MQSQCCAYVKSSVQGTYLNTGSQLRLVQVQCWHGDSWHFGWQEEFEDVGIQTEMVGISSEVGEFGWNVATAVPAAIQIGLAGSANGRANNTTATVTSSLSNALPFIGGWPTEADQSASTTWWTAGRRGSSTTSVNPRDKFVYQSGWVCMGCLVRYLDVVLKLVNDDRDWSTKYREDGPGLVESCRDLAGNGNKALCDLCTQLHASVKVSFLILVSVRESEGVGPGFDLIRPLASACSQKFVLQPKCVVPLCFVRTRSLCDRVLPFLIGVVANGKRGSAGIVVIIADQERDRIHVLSLLFWDTTEHTLDSRMYFEH